MFATGSCPNYKVNDG